MNGLQIDLEKTRTETSQVRAAFDQAIKTRDARKQNELTQVLAGLRIREESLLRAIENAQQTEQAYQARMNTPEAKRELKQIETMKADIDASALKLFKDAGALLRAALELFACVDQVRHLINKYAKDKNAGAEYAACDPNIRAAGLILSTLQGLRNSIQVRADLAKYFPDK